MSWLALKACTCAERTRPRRSPVLTPVMHCMCSNAARMLSAAGSSSALRIESTKAWLGLGSGSGLGLGF